MHPWAESPAEILGPHCCPDCDLHHSICCICRVFLPPSMRFSGLRPAEPKRDPGPQGDPRTASRERVCMGFQYFAGAAYRALTARKDGPSLYDVCDDVLLHGHLSNDSRGDAHLIKFYKTALRNPALRPLLNRAGLPELSDPARLAALRSALTQARDQDNPDWQKVGQPIADLLDSIELSHPKPATAKPNGAAPAVSELERVIRTCAAHLLGSYRKNGFIPTYAAFNLIGDADVRGREFLMALTGDRKSTRLNSSH